MSPQLAQEYVVTLGKATNEEVGELMARQMPFGPAPDLATQRKIGRFLNSKNERTVFEVCRRLAYWNKEPGKVPTDSGPGAASLRIPRFTNVPETARYWKERFGITP